MSTYLQITTRCNMQCAHCCYSCSPHKGEHMRWDVVCDAIAFARDMDSEVISIGGGEPTLHPRFFDILRIALQDFHYVWMATNGSRTKTMWRLARILDEDDFPRRGVSEEDCIFLSDSDQLHIALSQDYFHRSINYKVADYWKSRSKGSSSKYSIRDVPSSFYGVANQGRAKINQLGVDNKHCICNGLFINPKGQLKMCGCKNSPIIGDVWRGIEDKWKDFMDTEEYHSTECYNEARKHIEENDKVLCL